jgi:hypothetical protein
MEVTLIKDWVSPSGRIKRAGTKMVVRSPLRAELCAGGYIFCVKFNSDEEE